jgi:hypothetical protein
MSEFQRRNDPSASTGAATSSATEAAVDARKGDLRGASYEEGAALLKPGEDPAKAGSERAKRAQESWEKLFGEKIGGELFALVRKHVSVSDLTGYAKSGVGSLASAAGSLAKPTDAGAAGGIMDTKAEAAAVNKLMAALAVDVEKSAAAWLASEKGQKLAAAISQWVEEHPGWTTGIVATGAIAAAVVAYLQNVDVPELEKAFKLGGGWTASAALDLGKIQELSIQAARATLAYKTEGLEASVIMAHDGKTDVNSVTAKASATAVLGRGVSTTARGDLVAKDDGSLVLSASANVAAEVAQKPLTAEGGLSQTRTSEATTSDKVTGRIRYGESGEHREVSGFYDRANDTFSLSTVRAQDGGNTTRTDTVSRDGEGNLTSSRALDQKFGDHHSLGIREQAGTLGPGKEATYRGTNLATGLSLGLAAGTGTLAGHRANLDYKRGDVEAALDLEMKDQVSRLSLSAASAPSAGWSYGASLKMNLTDSHLEELGTNLGWQHPTEFKSFALEYKAKWLDTNPEMEHHFDGTFEYAVGRVSGRLSGSMDLQGRTLMGTRADLLMGYEINPNWTALGGLGYAGQRNADTHNMGGDLTYRTGVQYKDVAFTVGYTPDREQWTVGITIPLGRR